MANIIKGRKVYVCATAQPTDLDQSGFEALTWVQVKHVGNTGESGVKENVVNYDELETDVIQKAKGLANAGDPTLEVARNPLDPGQDALRTAAATHLDYAFKMEDDDAPSGYTNTVYYNRGKVLGPARPNGKAEDFVVEMFTLAFNQREVVVDPVALSAPANALAPSISGTTNAPDASSGILTAVVGEWTMNPTSYSYQWQQDTAGNGTWADISGATSRTYDPVVGNIGNCLRVQVTATNAAGSTTASSPSTAITVA